MSVFFAVSLIAVGLAVANGASGAGATAPPSWTNGTPTIEKNVSVPRGDGEKCTGYLQDSFITELHGSTSVCTYGSNGLKIGYFSGRSGYQATVQFPFSNDTHLLTGICRGFTCRYAEESDVLITQQSVGQYSVGAVIYRHASDRIKRVQSPDGTVSYMFDTTHPDYEVKDETGQYVWTPSFALSGNGKWAVVELRDSGLALINTDDFSARQITFSGYRYGYGVDPSEQLAVSDDGKGVALVGMNAGFNVFDVTQTCGRSLVVGSSSPPTTACLSTDFAIGNLFPNFRYAERPRFFGDGHQLEVVINNWVEDSRRVAFLAQGATKLHELKLLSLGDSFTSGEGETDTGFYEPGTNSAFDTCHVSTRAYPFLLASALGIPGSEMKSVACAGAKTTDIIGSNATYWGQGRRLGDDGLRLSEVSREVAKQQALDNFQPGRVLQSAFLDRYSPEMITIGIGGNDAGLMGKLSTCAMPGTCEWARGDGLRATAGEIKRLFGTLESLFSHLSMSNSDARIYVVGYPNVIESDGVCDPLTGFLFDYSERVFIHESLAYLNQIIHAAARAAGFTYINIEHSMDGKALCSGSDTGAMNGLRFGGDIAIFDTLPMLKIISAGTFHPTPSGHRLIADAILSGHPGLRQDATCSTDPMACVTSPPDIESSSYWGVDGGGQEQLSYATDFAHKVASGEAQLIVALPDGNLKPDSTVTLEIHSDPTSLGVFQTSSDGGITWTVSVPATISPGFHTLHLIGLNREDKIVDLYQFVKIGEEGQVLGLGSDEFSADNTKEVRAGDERRGVNTMYDGGPGVLGDQATASKGFMPQLSNRLSAQSEGLKPVYLGWYLLVGACVAGVFVTLWAVLRRKRWAKPGS